MSTRLLRRAAVGMVAVALLGPAAATTPATAEAVLVEQDGDIEAGGDTGIVRRSVAPVVETIGGVAPPERVRALTRPSRSLTRSERVRGRFVGAAAGRRVNGSMTTTFEAATPAKVQAVVDAAVQAWDDALSLAPNAPVEISVLWTDLGPRLLGQAGTEGEYRDAKQFPTDRWYPAALANQLANVDVNGAEVPEVMVELNSALADDWYLGTEGDPSFGQIDLYSVVLHEIAHGLGFLGSASASRGGELRFDHDPPAIYDDFVQNGDGQRLVDMDRDAVLRALTSGTLRYDIGFGRQLPLSSPANFVNGSSYSHFEESIDEADAGAMMTPALKNGEVQRSLDAAVLGVLDQIGWDLDTPLLIPDLDEVLLHSGGVTVAWTEDWTQAGTFAPDYVVGFEPGESSPSGVERVSRNVPGASTGSLRMRGLSNGSTYRIDVSGARAGRTANPAAKTSVLLAPTPNLVGDLKISAGTPVKLQWAAPTDSGEPISGYEVNYRLADSRVWKAPVGSLVSSTEWSQAIPEGRYWFRVRALNALGAGQWSETPFVGIGTGVTRPMPLDGQLARLYQAYFRRSPDGNGLAYWRQTRAEGASLEAVSGQFAASAEFGNTYGDLDTGAFVELLYQNVLGRPSDPGGFEYWTELIEDGATLGTVVLWFSEGAEFVAKTQTSPTQSSQNGAIERLHLVLLRRSPSRSEQSELSAIVNSRSIQAAAAELLERSELESVWDFHDDADLVDLIAQSVGSGPAQRDSFGARLKAGGSVAAIAVEVSQTPAFVVTSGTAP